MALFSLYCLRRKSYPLLIGGSHLILPVKRAKSLEFSVIGELRA